MLFVDSKLSNHGVDGATRMLLLERLQEKGLVPLIRSARLKLFDAALLGAGRVQAMERAVAAWTETEESAQYIRGELFCHADFVLFLVFDGAQSAGGGMRAGIVYSPETDEPQKKLDAFCRSVREALEAARAIGRGERGNGADFAEWRAQPLRALDGLAQFATAREENTGGKESGLERRLALETLEETDARKFLNRLRDSDSNHRVAELMLRGDASEGATEALINRLADTGLLRREVLVSCRKQGRALFTLPSLDALNVLTASNALCSECGAPVANEKVEELIAPSEAALNLLDEGIWLANRLRALLRELGIPDRQIAVRPASGTGEVNLMVNVCGETFLCVLRDGETNANHARRALNRLSEIEAEHLVVLSTGRMQEAGRVLLREHARRRAGRGQATEVLLLEGLEAAKEELQHAFERVSQRALTEELCALDASLGFSAGYLVATRFRLMQRQGALTEIAESAAVAAVGNLREI